MERDHQQAHAPAAEGGEADAGAEAAALGILFAEGTVPGVSDAGGGGDGARHLTASEQAFGAHETEAHATAHVAHEAAFAGEPLPHLKDILQGKLGGPKQNLAAFIHMVGQARVRPGTGGARTFTSPADGLAAIITGLILSIVEKYRHLATPKQEAILDRVLADHLKLLSTPMSRDGRSGGHRVSGVQHHGAGLAGPALSHGAGVRVETVNQTAVVLLGLQRLHDNPELAHQHARIEKLIDTLTPEFKASVVHCYRGKDVHAWHYGLSARLEDESHLKTTWDQLTKLARTKAKEKRWFHAEAEHIARLWPRVKGPWDGLSNAAGSLP